MLKVINIYNDNPDLQPHQWPPVSAFKGFTPELENFLNSDSKNQTKLLLDLNSDTEAYGQFINEGLDIIYSYLYGYHDSPCYLMSNPYLESTLINAKLILEEAFLESWLPIEIIPNLDNQENAVEYLRDFVKKNSGVYHELFDYLKNEATQDSMLNFLRLEVCRNEVVDDEVALLVCGLQGNMKKVIASNLWDECGNGALSQFHTYWLRRLINRLGDWEGLLTYRQTTKPWFSSITSNAFNTLLTRPGYKFRAYGCFLTTEAWVVPHFERLLAGLKRLQFNHDDITVYFEAHKGIDFQHMNEILNGLLNQTPKLSSAEVREILRGAHIAVAAGVASFERILKYLRETDTKIT